jgi:transcriptional regulator with XRE-family HTH domain
VLNGSAGAVTVSVPRVKTAGNLCVTLFVMTGRADGNLAFGHFGRQMHKERLARHWSLPELSERMGAVDNGQGINHGHLSRIERGVRPPTGKIADLCDAVFPERRGWFREYYEESKSWTPAGFRNWGEYEDKATRLHVWKPGIVHGLLQTEDYARTLIDIEPASTEEIDRARLANRMARQRRVLYRADPPSVWSVVDVIALYRLVGSAESMAAQMDRLLEVAALPHVTLTVMPAIAHPANASEIIIADDSAGYVEHLISGFTYVEDVNVSALVTKFDRLRGECLRVSESLALIREMRETWAAGVNPLTRRATAGPA